MANEIKKVGRPQINLDETFTKISPYLLLGYSFHKACLYAEVPYSSVIIYYNDDEDFRNRIERERTDPSRKARKNLIDAINAGNLQVSQEWLEAMEKEDFSKLAQVKDVTERTDEGILILREIIATRRLKAQKAKELAEPNEIQTEEKTK